MTPSQRTPAPVIDGVADDAPEEQLEAAIFTALADPAQPRLVFQPIVDLHRGNVVGYETLSRFVSPLSSPLERWFAAANQLGVGARLQADVLRRGIDRLPSLPDDTFLTVNLDPNLVTAAEVGDVLVNGGRLDRLVIELTEQTVTSDLRGMLAMLDRAREAGATVAMDDAGAGYSSLQNLLTIRPQLVKLDRSLVAGLDRDVVRRSLVRMLGDFVGQMDAWVLAEGLETPGELEACVDLEVPLGQGWLLGRPADDWQVQVPPAVSDVIQGRVLLREFAGTLAPLVDAVPAAASDEHALEAFVTQPLVEHVVIVDEHRRPTGILGRAAAARGDASCRDLLLARSTDRVADVAARVAARDAAARFDPVVCRDERGRYQGVVTVDRLLNTLAVAAPAPQ